MTQQNEEPPRRGGGGAEPLFSSLHLVCGAKRREKARKLEENRNFFSFGGFRLKMRGGPKGTKVAK